MGPAPDVPGCRVLGTGRPIQRRDQEAQRSAADSGPKPGDDTPLTTEGGRRWLVWMKGGPMIADSRVQTIYYRKPARANCATHLRQEALATRFPIIRRRPPAPKPWWQQKPPGDPGDRHGGGPADGPGDMTVAGLHDRENMKTFPVPGESRHNGRGGGALSPCWRGCGRDSGPVKEVILRLRV